MTLTIEQLDILKEISTMGAGHAATSLSQMLGKRIDLQVPKVWWESLNNVPSALGGAEKLVTAIYLSLTQEISGSLLLLFSKEDSKKLAQMLTGKETPLAKPLNDFEASALKELGNITTGAYVGALSQMMNFKIMHSVPYLETDMLGALLDEVLAGLALEADWVVLSETVFQIGEHAVTGHLLFIPNQTGMEKILEGVGLYAQKK